ncbi:protein DD3-3 [Hydra vulgaris]|uniref:protein DD3-3 n=1 Tax=Hydra vulgaris TaxID=6087 RepID=UPI001F5F82BB|nr:protein DD3-3 [Hydra vulgaris]
MIFRLQMLMLCALVQSDVYLHNPRGSNNRLDENGRERNNPNRLFNSQNNNRGGYNVGNLYYLEGSQLQIEWTNQHSCGESNANCDIIIQYMCSNTLRDGTTTDTIPSYENGCAIKDCDTNLKYGMHEDYKYYFWGCTKTLRNRGLFVADQNLGGDTSQYTRQNSGGTRYGYECPEERDYYPYWRPTPWKDIAVMTNDVRRCRFYQQESENVKSRFYCDAPGYIGDSDVSVNLPITKEACEKFDWPQGSGKFAKWKEIKKRLPRPDCIQSPKSRDNHNGNGLGGFGNTYNWTIPNDINENCVLRLRYNISTGDLSKFASTSSASIGALVGLSDTEATNRGYVFKNNPVIQPLKTGNPTLDGKLQLRLAINTAQYGRTFQDRSHKFAIRPRPAELKRTNIYNLNVRGKRGNIVQVYPAVEYDFVPSRLTLSASDAIHIQWTGSNTNPLNNAGQGTAGTDRSNIILLKDKNFPNRKQQRQDNKQRDRHRKQKQQQLPVIGHYGNNYPMLLNTSKSFLGFDLNDVKQLAFSNPNGVSSDPLLNDASVYFDLGARSLKNAAGTYYYMCTRNNNFSNRSQKGKIVVLPQNDGRVLPPTKGGVSSNIKGGNNRPQSRGRFNRNKHKTNKF